MQIRPMVAGGTQARIPAATCGLCKHKLHAANLLRAPMLIRAQPDLSLPRERASR